MSKEGYLLLHEEGRRAQLHYCVLGEGKLQCFSRRHNGVLVREVALSRAKLKVRGVPEADAHNCPFSFSVRLQRAKIRDGRQILYGKAQLLLLSAPSWGERKAWGNAIHAWQRNYWGEPQHRALNLSDDELEVYFETQKKVLQLALQSAGDAQDDEPETPPSAGTAGARRKTPHLSLSPTTVSHLLRARAQSLRSMGHKVGKKIRASSVTFSLPPMGLSVSAAAVQQPTQPTQSQPNDR